MFIIEKLLSDHRAAVERWENAREKWKDEHEYYSSSDYEESHPRPLNWVKVIPRAMLMGVAVGLMAVLVIGFAKEIKVSDGKDQAAQVEQKNCQRFNKNDKVRIQYGDHTGNVGTIIGGCEEGESYQVKIDEGSKANVTDNNPEPVDVGGWTIAVDSSENLVVIEDKKE